MQPPSHVTADETERYRAHSIEQTAKNMCNSEVTHVCLSFHTSIYSLLFSSLSDVTSRGQAIVARGELTIAVDDLLDEEHVRSGRKLLHLEGLANHGRIAEYDGLGAA